MLIAGLWAGRWAGERIDELTSKSSDRLMMALGKVARGTRVSAAGSETARSAGCGRRRASAAPSYNFV